MYVAMPLYTHPSGLLINLCSLDDSAFLRDIGCEAHSDLFVYNETDRKELKDCHFS